MVEAEKEIELEVNLPELTTIDIATEHSDF
jgi:hypothetical protein